MIGRVLVYGAVASSVGSSLAFLVAVFERQRLAKLGKALLYATAVQLFGAFSYLTYQFATTDYTNSYVWNHTADYLSIFYRLSSVYAGVEGSLLLWSLLVAVAVSWLGRHRFDDGYELVLAIAAVVTSIFAFMVALQPPFAELSFAVGETAYGPAGLNPLLKNPYMGIHPPVTFAGYALTVPPFAIAAAHLLNLLRGNDGLFSRWLPTTMNWLRLAWVTLSAAIGLGAIWSYNTLGWGGLWAWDPVETAVLISWIVVTAAVHALGNFRRREYNVLLAPTLVALSFPGVIFARFITQSGTSPLHSFGGGVSQPMLGLLLGGLLLSLGPPLFLWVSERTDGAVADDRLASTGNLLSLSVLLIGVFGFISLWGVMLPILAELLGVQSEVGVNFYNLWSLPVAILVLLLLGFYNEFTANGRSALPVLGGVAVLTLVAALVPVEAWKIAPDSTGLVYGALGQVNYLVFGPPVAYVVLGFGERLRATLPNLESRDEKIALVGRTLVHVGLVLVIVSSPMTYLFAASASGFVPASDEVDGAVAVGDSEYYIEMSELEHESQPTEVALTAKERRVVTGAVQAAALSPETVAGESRSNAIIRGTVTDQRPTGTSRSVQLNGTSVWIAVPRTADVNLTNGSEIWAQGRINGSGTTTWVEASSTYVGNEATDVVTPNNRLMSRSSSMTVYRGRTAIDSGRISHDRYLGYGTFSEPHVHQGLLYDTYVVAQEYRSIHGIPALHVLVKRVPLINLVRIGIALLLIGGLLIYRFDAVNRRRD